MPYQADWLVDKVVLHVQYTGNVENSELSALNEVLVAYLNEGEAPVHIISDQSNMKKLNADLKGLQTYLPIMRDKRWGYLMIVDADPITTFFSKMVTHLFGLKMRSLKTIDEAKNALGIEDPRLTDIFIDSVQSDAGV